MNEGKSFLHARFVPSCGAASLENTIFTAPPKACDIRKGEIRIRKIGEGENLRLFLSSDTPTFYVTPEFSKPGARFSDSVFHLLPGEEKEVLVTGTEGFIPAEEGDHLTLHTLRNY